MAKQVTERLQALEDAIYEVLDTRYKKDAKEAHALVESYGYKIHSAKRGYAVRNPETGRELEGWFSRQFDLLGFLNKPMNKDYRIAQQVQVQPIGEAKNRGFDLIWRRKHLERYDRQIESYKKDIKYHLEQIEKYQDYILREKLEKQEAELALEESKKELREKYGLKKGA